MILDPTKPIDRFYGALVSLIGVGVLTAGFFTIRQPVTPTLTISPQGIRFTDLSSKLIPWNEISGVETEASSTGSLHIPRRVTMITVSRPFYDTLGSMWPHRSAVSVKLYDFGNALDTYDNAVDVVGDVVRIPIARRLVHSRAGRLQAEIEARWRAFRE